MMMPLWFEHLGSRVQSDQLELAAFSSAQARLFSLALVHQAGGSHPSPFVHRQKLVELELELAELGPPLEPQQAVRQGE